MTTLRTKPLNRVFPEPPETWVGSRPEWAIYHALLSLGKKPDVDFDYQSSFMGGRMSKGGAVVDFLIFEPPTAINIQSTYYHYQNVNQRQRGEFQRAQLEGMGITVIFIDEEDALREPRFYVKEALEGRSHARVR